MNDNELLLLDLGGRLQYGVKVDVDGTFHHDGVARTLTDIFSDRGLGFDNNGAFYGWYSFNMKPYLRPMSSMTKEERKEYEDLIIHREHINAQGQEWDIDCFSFEGASRLINWLNAHHFDYRGLIKKGLALEAPEGMYNV